MSRYRDLQLQVGENVENVQIRSIRDVYVVILNLLNIRMSDLKIIFLYVDIGAKIKINP